MTHRIGIDPGATGALVLLDEKLRIVEWEPMPVIVVGSATRVNGPALAAILAPWAESHAFVEQVGAMPGQGVSSMFSFGYAAGVVAGALGALQIPTTMVLPGVWKKRAGLVGKDKDAARSRATQLWPDWRALDLKGKGQALADAALIARFGVVP